MAQYFGFILFLLVVTQAQRLIDLKTLIGNNGNNSISNGTTGIYATATMDNVDLLKHIWIDSSVSGLISVYDVTQYRYGAGSDWMEPWIAKGITTLTTELNQQQLGGLTGTIYITSEKQAQSKSHRVYDVSQIQDVRIDAGTFGDTTVVFLNSRFFDTTHMQSTTFSKWNQESSASVKMYQGIPSDDMERNSTQIFSNPILISGNSTFVPVVNDFTVTLGAFYFKFSGNGSFVFRTSPAYFDIDQTQTKDYTSTGFFMKSLSEIERLVRVNLLTDLDFNSTFGVNSIATIPKNGNVTVNIENTQTYVGMTFPQSDAIIGWKTDFVGSMLTISSKETTGGQYFLQYYTIQGQRINDPVTGPTTASSIQTSTKSTGKLNFCISMLISIIGAVLVSN